MSDNRAIIILKASAGSGKTFRLTLHYISLLLLGSNRHKKILAVTFTNKATAEMKERILSVLAGLARNSDESFILSYRDILLKTFPNLSRTEIQERARQAYINILHDYSNFSISTIDKFVQKVVRSFGYELGFDPGYRIETNSRKVISDLSGMLHTSLDNRPELTNWIIQLAKSQIRANKSWNYERILSSIALQIFSERYWDFEQALSLPENASIFEAAFNHAQNHVSAFEANVLQYIEQIQSVLNESGLEQDEVANRSKNIGFNLNSFKASELSDVISKLEKYWIYGDDENSWLPKKSSKKSEILALFHRVQPILNNLRDYYESEHRLYFLSVLLLEEIHYLRLMEEMNRLLAKYRRDNRLLLIGDASRLLSGITKEQAQDLSFVWEKTGVRYSHFLIDEFQDTSEKQWANFLPLIKNAIAEWEGPHTHHLLVGDVKQSIYRWRNGDWRILHQQAERDLGRNYIQYENLGENFRSSPGVVAFNNVIFEYGSRWLQKQVNQLILKDAGPEFYQRFWCEKMGYDRVIEQAYSEVRQKVPESNKEMAGIVELRYLDVRNNAHRPGQTLDEALQQTADRLYQWIEVEKRYRPAQIGILVRSNARAIQLIDFLYQDLRRRNSPDAFQVISGDALKLESNDAIKLLIESLKLVIAGPEDDRLLRATCLQLYRQLYDGVLSPVSTDQWLNLNKDSGLLPGEIVETRQFLSQLPLTELVERMIEIYGLNANGEHVVEQHLPYLFAFHDVLAQYSEIGDGSIDSFLNWWMEEHDNFSLPAQETGQAIQVMTIHKSKGLAFDVVVLPFLDWEIGRFDTGSRVWSRLDGTPYEAFRHLPLNFGSKSKVLKSAVSSEYLEERMLRAMDTINEVYVACTRAKTHLYINLIQDTGQLNTFLAGDIVRFALKDYGSEAESLYNINLNEFDPPDAVEPENSEIPWDFTSYPQGSFLKQTLETRAQGGRKDLDSYARKGNLAHLLLSRVDDRQTLDAEIRKMRAEGLVLKEEEADIRGAVVAILEHPGLQALEKGAVSIHKERSILDADGKLYRPDKVWVKGEHATVVDFKFTGQEAEKHRQQVLKYRHLLLSMGFVSVRAFLFYGNINKLTEIEVDKLL